MQVDVFISFLIMKRDAFSLVGANVSKRLRGAGPGLSAGTEVGGDCSVGVLRVCSSRWSPCWVQSICKGQGLRKQPATETVGV